MTDQLPWITGGKLCVICLGNDHLAIVRPAVREDGDLLRKAFSIFDPCSVNATFAMHQTALYSEISRQKQSSGLFT
jgi:hypothetical protein